MPRFFLKNSWKVFLSCCWCFSNLAVYAELSSDQAKLAAANTSFAFDLLKQIAQEQPGTNIFISPFSASTVLQMAANGATGGTWAEMRRVMKTTGLPPESLNAACRDLNESLNSQTNVILNLANAIWYKEGAHLKPGFVSVSTNFFRVKLGPVDFQKPETAQLINEWADHSTRGKIKDVVSWPFDPLTQVVLASAIYFKGQWLCPFDKSQTKPQSFHLADGKEIPVPMMRQDGEFSYQENKDFQAVSLGYVGWKQDMYILLPGKNSNLKQLLARFNGETWQNTIHPHFEYRKGRLVLPKFKLEYDVKLNAPLQALGMKRAFSNGSADFSAMSDESLFISEVKQKSFVEVNETGTEAAAISQASISKGGSRNPPRPFEMIVDRPFFFVIEDDKTQSILFMGMVYDPAGQGGGG